MLDADGTPTEDVTTAEEFPFGTQEVQVMFDYEGMTDGQEVVFKVFIDGEEDPSWRVIAPWDLGASGSASKPLSLPTAIPLCWTRATTKWICSWTGNWRSAAILRCCQNNRSATQPIEMTTGLVTATGPVCFTPIFTSCYNDRHCSAA